MILLAGGDKRTQSADIKTALRLARNLSGESNMRKTKTTRYDVAEHLRTPEEMAAYLEACLDEAKGTPPLSPRRSAILRVRGA